MERIKIVVVALFVCSFASVHANVYYHIMVENIYGDGYVVEKWDVPEAEALSSYAYIIEYTDELDRVAKLVFYYKRWDSIWWNGIVDDPHCIYYSYGDSAISIVEMSYFDAIYESRDTVSGNSDIGRLEGNSTPFAYRMVIPCYKVDSCYYLNSQGYMEECYVSRNMIEYVQEYVQKNDLNTKIDLINMDNRLVLYDYFWNCINDNDVPSRMFPYKYDTIPFYSYSLKKVGMCREKNRIRRLVRIRQ